MVGSWWDVVLIPPHGYVKFRYWFNVPAQEGDMGNVVDDANRVGAWVYHCHLLRHEDRGMMQVVKTQIDPTRPNNAPLILSAPQSLHTVMNQQQNDDHLEIRDDFTATEDLVFQWASDNELLVNASNFDISLESNSLQLTLTPTPNRVGTAKVQLSVIDTQGLATNSELDVRVLLPTPDIQIRQGFVELTWPSSWPEVKVQEISFPDQILSWVPAEGEWILEGDNVIFRVSAGAAWKFYRLINVP
jgi:hypothetical protein